MLTFVLKTRPPKPLNIKFCNGMLQFEEEPNKTKMIQWMVSVTGVSTSALKIIFQQQLDSLLLLQVMLVLVRWFAILTQTHAHTHTHTHTYTQSALLAISHHLCLELIQCFMSSSYGGKVCQTYLSQLLTLNGARGGVVVKALCYKPAGRGFDSRWCHWNFSVT